MTTNFPEPGHPDERGRVWVDEKMAWCIQGLNREWIDVSEVQDSQPPYARNVRSHPGLFDLKDSWGWQ